MLHDQIISRIRTHAPIWAGVIVFWLATKLNIVVDETTKMAIATVIAGVLSSVYYEAVRLAELRWPWVGVLLGSAKQPKYHIDGTRREV